jgi:hypothetical protein
VKILRLGTSNDQEGRVPADAMSHRIVERELSRITGQQWETVVRRIWPTPALPGLVERWMAEEQPDVVFVGMPAYWVTYESVPLRIQRRLGRLGAPLAELGVRASRNRRLETSRTYHALRRLAIRVIGGEPNFTPAEVIAVMSDVFAILARHEEAVVVSNLPRGRRKYVVTAMGVRRAEARRLEVVRAMTGVLDRLHIEHSEPVARAHYLQGITTPAGPDQLHSNEEGHRLLAAEQLDLILRGLRKAGMVPA